VGLRGRQTSGGAVSQLVDLFYGAIVVIFGIADLWWVVYRTPAVSRTLAAFGWRVSVMPFACGAFIGRLASAELGPIGGDPLKAAGLLVAFFVLVYGIHWFLRTWLELPSWFGVLYVPCGIATGMHFWPV